jgi:hypothetical protein
VRFLRGKTLIHKLLTEVFEFHLSVKISAFKMVDLANMYRHEGNFYIANHLIQRVFDFQERKFINSQLDNDAQGAWRDILEQFRNNFPQIVCPVGWCKQGSRGGKRSVSVMQNIT